MSVEYKLATHEGLFYQRRLQMIWKLCKEQVSMNRILRNAPIDPAGCSQ